MSNRKCLANRGCDKCGGMEIAINISLKSQDDARESSSMHLTFCHYKHSESKAFTVQLVRNPAAGQSPFSILCGYDLLRKAGCGGESSSKINI